MSKYYIEDCLQVCANWGLIPTEFRQCMTWEEQVLWLSKFLKEKVVPALNGLSEQVDILQNWFDNLDVQEEVNNKLDEMAESGQLADIIAQYLELAGVLAFDNVAALAAAENLGNGSTARTLGMNAYSDGLGAYYKIREVTNDDTIDGYDLVAITNDPLLVAERIPGEYVTPEMYGAAGDGETNDYDAMQAFLASPVNDKRLKAGATYAIEGALTPASNTVLEGNGATIKRINATNNNRVLYVDAWGETKENILIHNVVFDGDKVHASQSFTPLVNFYTGNEGVLKNITIADCTVQNVAGHGIGCYNDNSTTPVKTSFQNVNIKNVTVKTIDYVGIQQATVCTTIEGCNISGTGAENITVDTGCVDCLVDNCAISAYGQGGGIGIDESTGVKITRCYFDGTSNTAPAGYKNGITINAETGINYNTVIADNVFANNDTGIRIGSANTTIATTAIGLSITGNTFKNSTTYSVFAQKSDSSTKVVARGNAYDQPFDFGGDVAVATVPKCYNIDYPFNLWNLVAAKTGFSLSKSYVYVYEGIVYFDMVVTSVSTTLSEGWTGIVNFGVTSKYNAELRIPVYNSDMSTLVGYKDSSIYGSDYNVWWFANEDVRSMVVKGSFPVA